MEGQAVGIVVPLSSFPVAMNGLNKGHMFQIAVFQKLAVASF